MVNMEKLAIQIARIDERTAAMEHEIEEVQKINQLRLNSHSADISKLKGKVARRDGIWATLAAAIAYLGWENISKMFH